MSFKWYKDSYYFYKQEQIEPYKYCYINTNSSLNYKSIIYKHKGYYKSFDYVASFKSLTLTDILNLNPKNIHNTSFIKEYLESLVDNRSL